MTARRSRARATPKPPRCSQKPSGEAPLPDVLDKLSEFVAAAQGIDYQMGVLTDDCPGMDNGNIEPCAG